MWRWCASLSGVLLIAVALVAVPSIGVPLLVLASFIALLAAFVALCRGADSQVAPRDSAGTSRVEKEKITPVGAVALFVSFSGAVYLAYQVSACLFLVYLYGLFRVVREGLHFVSMPKGGPWVVSNGDQITEGHYVQFLFALPLMIGLNFVFYAIAARVSPWPLFTGGPGRIWPPPSRERT